MARQSRAGEARRFILDEIKEGRFAPGQRLPAEDRLAEAAETSRLTIREAVKGLAAEHVLQTRQGSGTYVQPVSSWTSVDAVLHLQRSDDSDLLGHLQAVRGFIEVGAAELFAERVTEAEFPKLEERLDEMRAAHAAEDLEAMTTADLAFHQIILAGSGNPFVTATLEPLSQALARARRATSQVAAIRGNAIAEHQNIIDALRSGDPRVVRRAMLRHMKQTRRDSKEHNVTL